MCWYCIVCAGLSVNGEYLIVFLKGHNKTCYKMYYNVLSLNAVTRSRIRDKMWLFEQTPIGFKTSSIIFWFI